MISLYTIFYILIIHWFADFVFQTDWQAKNKSSSMVALLDHTTAYSVFWILPFLGLCFINHIELVNLRIPATFIFITFLAHTATDYYTSRLNTKLYKAGKTHQFFVSIGFDQILHYVQLFLTYYYLTKLG